MRCLVALGKYDRVGDPFRGRLQRQRNAPDVLIEQRSWKRPTFKERSVFERSSPIIVVYTEHRSDTCKFV